MESENSEEFLYEDITYKIRGACFDVYNKFGGDFKEKIVDRSLSLALRDKGLKVEDQKRISIKYKGKKVGTYIPDKVVEEKVMIEVKCKPFLLKEDKKQFWRYLKATKYRLGLLVNFSPQKLEIERRIYDKARDG